MPLNGLTQNPVLRGYVLPVLDVLLLAFLIYQIYRILVRTRAVQLVRGALFIGVFYLAAFLLRLDTLRWVLNLLVPGVVVGLAIIFQPELRRIFTRLGQTGWFRGYKRAGSRCLQESLAAAETLSARRHGALFAFTRGTGLAPIVETGTRLNAELSTGLLVTVFSPNTPLHDGAVVISGDRLVAAGCLLPLSERPEIAAELGTRHRAALGLAEESDAVVLVVSEESGSLSLAYDSNLHFDLSLPELSRRLRGLLEEPRGEE